MKKNLYILLAALSLGTPLSKGVIHEHSLEELISSSAAICQGSVLRNQSFEKEPQASIFTATDIAVSKSFKGHLTDTIRIEHCGGELNGRGETYCGQPVFIPGIEYLLFLRINDEGILYSQAQFDLSDPQHAHVLASLQQQGQTRKYLSSYLAPETEALALKTVLPGSTGYSSRFLQGDRNEPIEYLIDMDSLPAGITTNQALNAVENALAAWSRSTLLSFKFIGIESFGTAAPYAGTADERIYIQLHDNYNYIPQSNKVGIGGRSYSFNLGNWPNGGLGGRVGTNEFDRTTHGFVVIENKQSDLSDPTTLEEVICHELGHALSLAHSSEDPNESNTTLSDATMYYKVHADDRGAILASWDISTIQTIHPTNNTPPYGYARSVAAITSPTPPSFSSGANQVEITAFDRQGDAVPVLLTENSYEANGTFSLMNPTNLFFTPSGFFGDAVAEPGTYYALRFIRMDDGTNQSPPIAIRVTSFNADNNSDLLQDSWANRYAVSGATADPDHDTFTNFEEWQIDSDPTNSVSGLYVGFSEGSLSWQARPEELYQVESTDDLLLEFEDDGNPIIATSTNQVLDIEYASGKFYRVRRLN